MNNLKMVAPWVEFYREIEYLFKKDPAIRTVLDEENKVIKLYVTGTVKADALSRLLPTEKVYGNVTVTINVIPANEEQSTISLIRDAFCGNEALVDICSITGIFSNDINYVIFKKEVVQYFNDDLSDAHGVRSTLYQDLAKDVFGDQPSIYFCTDTEWEEVGRPLGEWP